MSDTSGADRYGFDPFPGRLRLPGADAIPGDLTHWSPEQGTVMDAYNYAALRFAGIKDKTCLTLLAQHGIGDHL